MSSFNCKTIYQAIWDADQRQNGVPAILKSLASSKDTTRGYAIVNEPKNFTKDTKVIEEVLIPREKKKTYNLCENLFNNYVLRSSKKEETETESPEETIEIDAFINAIIDTDPMKTAREYMAPNQNDAEWFTSIREKWFTPFVAIGGAKNRSGFEHVFVGEDTGKLGGYHFWYKYYLDDGAGRTDGKDAMDYLGVPRRYRGTKTETEGRTVPEVVTLSHDWDASDTPLNKETGGFWVGCSPEGLIALGMARFKDEQFGSTKAVINNVEYDLLLFSEVDRRVASNQNKVAKHINTFYPIFKGKVGGTDTGDAVDPSPPKPEPPVAEPPVSTPSSEDVKIIAALVNPSGDDKGKETVTIRNISDTSVDVGGWTIVDKNGNFFEVDSGKDTLGAGEVYTITLPGTGKRPAQLGNKGGSITLKDGSGEVVSEVIFTRAQASKQGFTVLF